jgi:hypothetical protein
MEEISRDRKDSWSRAGTHICDQKPEFIVCKIGALAPGGSRLLIFCGEMFPVAELLVQAVDNIRRQSHQGLADDLVGQETRLDDSIPSLLRSCNR